MTKAEKKALIKSAKEAGVKDEKLLAEVVGGLSIEQAVLKQKALDEQGKDVAGNQPGATTGSGPEGTTEENKPADNAEENQGPDAGKPEDKQPGSEDSQDSKPKEKEKVWEVNCNLSHNGKEYKKGHPIHEDDKVFPELKKLGFLN